MRVEDWLGKDNKLGYDIWSNKYQHNNESFDEWLDRVSAGKKDLRKLIEDKKFLFGGRALANRGTDKKGSLNNCYSAGFVDDTIEAIMQMNTDLALTFKAQGGQGVSLSKIRPKGTPVGEDFESDGIVPFMEIFNTTTSSISQGGARKGALMISLDIRHKEAPTFITIKTNEDKITKANLSLEIDDSFMQAVKKAYETGDEVILHEKREYSGHIVEYDIKPLELYKLMMKTVYDWGEPGCIFTTPFRNYNLMQFDDDYQIETCNPCFTGDTIIAVADGRNGVAIKDLCNTTFPVYSAKYSNHGGVSIKGDKWVAEVKSAKAFKTGTKKVITVQLSDGSEFRCTPEHRLALADGTYCEAQNCKGKQLAKFFTFSNQNTNKSYRHINSITCNRQYRYIADYYNILYDPKLTIHHLDHDSTNDCPDNLVAASFNEHMIEQGQRQKENNTITRDINYKFNQGLRNISANGKRYGWSQEKINAAKEEYKLTHQDIYTEKIDKNVYLNDIIYVIDIIDNNEVEDVFDLTVEDNHNFYIITNTNDDRYLNCSGVLVHNCGEQPLKKHTSCNLGSLNLSEFVVNKYTKEAYFDFEDFKQSVRIAVEALDDIIDENLKNHPLEAHRINARDYRNIGLGVFGFANMLFELGLTYGKPDTIDFTSELFKILFVTALEKSNDLAREKGMFPKCNPDLILKANILKGINNQKLKQNIKQYGLRNCSLISVAPTGLTKLAQYKSL